MQVELLPDASEPGRWVLPGLGSFLRTGRTSRAATAEAGGRRWSIKRVGIVRTGFSATDEAGALVGEVRNPIGGRSDGLRWAGRDIRLVREAPTWGYALWDGERRIAEMTPRRRGKRELDVVLDDPSADPGLLLFGAFIAQAYEDDASFPPPEIG